MTQAEEPEIDLAAALKLPGPGLQPTKSHKPTRARAKPAKFPSTNNINTSSMGIKDTNLEDTTLLSDSSKINQGVPLKDQLTQKELKFLDIYLSGEVTMERAMLLAGYENYHPRYVYDKASKILQKYESQGEVLKKYSGPSDLVRSRSQRGSRSWPQRASQRWAQLNAHALAAKCLQMTQEVAPIRVGFQLIIKCSQEESQLEPGRVRPAIIYLREHGIKED